MIRDSLHTPTLHVVHCVDTEGPLTEELSATFDRLEKVFGISLAPSHETLIQLQQKELPLQGREEEVARMLAPSLLKYNNSWDDIDAMLDDAMSLQFRNRTRDDAGVGWVYSWHCLDHAGYASNPRQKDTGWGNIFRFYKNKLAQMNATGDEINWHFHPLSFTRNPTQCATSYVNSYDILIQVLCRRLIDEQWIPLVNRPGFHSERPDSHAFLEQWIPYDYANQADDADSLQPDLGGGRFGDWRRAPKSWTGYHPHHDDYQVPGNCHRWIFRCMNVGTRVRTLTLAHVEQAFHEAETKGSAILSFANHDYRDIRPDVEQVRLWLEAIRGKHPTVKLRFSGALDAARIHTAFLEPDKGASLSLNVSLDTNILTVRVEKGVLFGPQPFMAFQTKSGDYFHDNMDVQIPGKHYSYVLDAQTIVAENLATIGIGAAGRNGSAHVKLLRLA